MTAYRDDEAALRARVDALQRELDERDAALDKKHKLVERVDQFGTEVLMLTTSPAERFVALTEAVASKWPEHPPYEGIHDEVIPHLTVAHTGKGASFDAIRARVKADLPIESRAE